MERDPEARQRALFWAALFLAVVLRLFHLGASSLWYDEAASLYLGQHSIAPEVLLDPSLSPEPPVNPMLTRLWQETVDVFSGLSVTSSWHDFLLRLLPFAFGVAALPMLYQLVLLLVGSRSAALIAMFLFAISPFQIRYAQELRIYSLYVLIALVAVWCMVRALESGKRRHWFGMVAALAVLMYCHYFSMWLIFSLNIVFVALLGKCRRHLWTWTAANAVLMVLIAPMLYRAFGMHAETQQIEIPWYPNPTWKTPLLTFKAYFAGFGPSAWAYWPLFLLACIFWCIGIYRTRASATAPVLIGVLTWAPLIGCTLLWGRADFSFYEHRIFIFSGVTALIGVAAGIDSLGRFRFAGLAAVALLTLPCLGSYYGGQLHPVKMHRLAIWDKVDFRSAARYLEGHWEAGDRLLYASHFSAYPMLHYFPKEQTRIGWDESDQGMFIRTMGHEEILRAHKLMPIPKEEATEGAQRIWFLSTEGTTFEWQPTTLRVHAWLDQQFERQDEAHFDGVVLRLYTPRN